MMARSVSSANPINRRQTARALPLRLGLPTEFRRLEVELAIDLADARRLQSLAHRFANRAPWDRAGAGSTCRFKSVLEVRIGFSSQTKTTLARPPNNGFSKARFLATPPHRRFEA